jgi:hypothetical protein
MSVSAIVTGGINYDYRAGGEVLCRNPKGLVFFLRAEPPAARPASPPPAPRSWSPVEATREVEVKRHVEPQPITEMARVVPAAEPAPAAFTAVDATREVEVRRAAEPQPVGRGTGPLPNVPSPGKAPERGWFGKLFGK